jgi:hypothetical protein
VPIVVGVLVDDGVPVIFTLAPAAVWPAMTTEGMAVTVTRAATAKRRRDD